MQFSPFLLQCLQKQQETFWESGQGEEFFFGWGEEISGPICQSWLNWAFC